MFSKQLLRLFSKEVNCVSYTKVKRNFQTSIIILKDREISFDENIEIEDDFFDEDEDSDLKPSFHSNAEHPDYNDIEINYKGSNAFEIMTKSFKLSQHQIDKAFYNARCRKNHIRVGKKATKITYQKDVFDLVIKYDEDFVYVNRVQSLGPSEDDDTKMWVRKWEKLKLPRIKNPKTES